MGLNFNYLLYFEKDRIWDVLQALAEFSDLGGACETQINFPDHVLTLPFEGSYMSKSPVNYDDPEFEFALSQIFDEDDAILDYMIARGDDLSDRSPPDGDIRQWGIGFIYLTVYADISSHWAFDEPADIVLFQFGTTGTKMSMLFYYSTSIREKFISLLENNGGLYGIFDQEVDYGELFWYKGKPMAMTLLTNYPLPDELEDYLNEQN